MGRVLKIAILSVLTTKLGTLCLHFVFNDVHIIDSLDCVSHFTNLYIRTLILKQLGD